MWCRTCMRCSAARQNGKPNGDDHAPVTRGRMRTQYPLPHGPLTPHAWESGDQPDAAIPWPKRKKTPPPPPPATTPNPKPTRAAQPAPIPPRDKDHCGKIPRGGEAWWVPRRGGSMRSGVWVRGWLWRRGMMGWVRGVVRGGGGVGEEVEG